MAFSHSGFAGFYPGTGQYDAVSRRAALDRLDRLATAFDTAFIVPGTNVRFGVESLLRLIPGIGDAAASALSCYLLYEAHRLGVPRPLFARMLLNVLLEGTVGAARRRCFRRAVPRQPPQYRAASRAFRAARLRVIVINSIGGLIRRAKLRWATR
jgi:hypothetical protein